MSQRQQASITEIPFGSVRKNVSDDVAEVLHELVVAVALLEHRGVLGDVQVSFAATMKRGQLVVDQRLHGEVLGVVAEYAALIAELLDGRQRASALRNLQ